MKGNAHNATWYSIGLSTAAIAGAGIYTYQNPSLDRLHLNTTYYPYIIQWAVLAGISFVIYLWIGVAVESLLKKRIKKRMHFWPLTIGLTFAPLFLYIGRKENALIALLLFLFLHPIVANILLSLSKQEKS